MRIIESANIAGHGKTWGTRKPMRHIAARLAPLPPSNSVISAGTPRQTRQQMRRQICCLSCHVPIRPNQNLPAGAYD